MAMNKYMHPRNIYRTPPDFSILAKTHPEFAEISKLDVNGKVNIDFKDAHSLRILTKCLLQTDFDLKVEIPEDRLVPTLPLRLNYILWLEDLMAAIDIQTVSGIDIGTGACAVYPLLGAKKNKWNMIGTESDEFSTEIANKNVLVNNLDGLIKIAKTTSPTLLQHLFTDDELNFDFCMCNPPFYSNIQELLESRSPARPPPKNGFTGSPQELITEGGELEFIRKLIAESKFINKKIQIYTTMVGHKYNLHVLLEDLKSDNISHTYTEFCQGRITRWGLAWTFKEYNIHDLVPARSKPPKKSSPLTCQLPSLANVPYNLENINKKINSIFNDLSIKYKVINKRGFSVTLDVLAETATWSNQRKRKRMLKRFENDAKKIKTPGNEKELTNVECETSTIDNREDDKLDSTQQAPGNKKEENDNKCVNISKNTDPIIHALIKIVKRADNFVLEADFLNGTGGKEGVHQIMQYIKNNWK